MKKRRLVKNEDQTITTEPLPSSGALKFDTDKIRMELLSVDFLNEVSKVLTFGAKKYTIKDAEGNVIQEGANNWRKGFAWSRLYGSAMRHLTAHMSGDSIDEESGLSHLSHAACCLMFLIEHETRQLGTDDRYVHEREASVPLEEVRKSVMRATKQKQEDGPTAEELAEYDTEVRKAASFARWEQEQDWLQEASDAECESCGAYVEEGLTCCDICDDSELTGG